MVSLPGTHRPGLECIWIVSANIYAVRGVYEAVVAATADDDFSGKRGFFPSCKKRPIIHLFLGLTTNGVLLLSALRSYFFGKPSYRWVELILSQPLLIHRVTTDHVSALMGLSMLMTHLTMRLYHGLNINIFTSSTQPLIDNMMSVVYMMLAGASILTEAPVLTAQTGSWFDWNVFRWRHIAGMGIFMWATLYNHKFQYSLAKLRKNRAGHVVTEDHKNVGGGWFDLVACPHLLMEITIHASIGLVLGYHNTWWLCTLSTSANCTVRALRRHRWYKKYYVDNSSRNAIVPFFI